MRFSIRDLLLLTVIVALAVGWWLDRVRQRRYFGEMERLIKTAESEREAALQQRDGTFSLTLDLMKDLDVIHPGWRHAKWGEIPKPIQRDTDGRKLKQSGKAWGEFQALKSRIDAGEAFGDSSSSASNPAKMTP